MARKVELLACALLLSLSSAFSTKRSHRSVLKVNSIHSLLTHTSARKFVPFLDAFQSFIQEQTLHDDKRANHSENFSCHEFREMLIGQSRSVPYLP
jgi:hypothetical protein